ncbi:MAG TPA: TIM barrel protein [Opitutaceae bacterium]|nr:TIM barrel protein [Opitutaceae bacterium]
MELLRCFSTLGCPSASLDDVREIARRHNLPLVELRALDGTLELADHFETAFGSPAGFAERLRQTSVQVVALDTSARLIGGSEHDWRNLERLAPWADAAAIPWLRVFDGGSTGTTAEIDEAIAHARRWRERRDRQGWRVDILVETHDALTRSAAILQFCAGCDAAVLWDAHHTWKRGGEDPVDTWRATGSRVKHIHVKDSMPDANGANGWSYVLPGTGRFPMQPLLRELTHSKFQGAVSLEWERQWVPTLPPLEIALASAEKTGWW